MKSIFILKMVALSKDYELQLLHKSGYFSLGCAVVAQLQERAENEIALRTR